MFNPQNMFVNLLVLTLVNIAGAKTYSKTCTSAVIVVSSDAADGFPADNVLTHSSEEAAGAQTSFWLAPEGSPGHIILDLGCVAPLNTVELVNTRGGETRSRGAKGIKVSVGLSKDGPWSLVVWEVLEDASNGDSPPPLLMFTFPIESARFVKVEVVTWYGDGGGMQYFRAFHGETFFYIFYSEYNFTCLCFQIWRVCVL